MTASTIFIVDDTPSVLKGLARLLRSAGFHPAVFRSAREFLDQYDPGVPGCLVLDVAMPGLNGMELQEMLMAKGGGLPIIFLTGHGDIPMSVQAMKRGAVDFLTKPVNDEELFPAIRKALERDQAAREARAESAAIQGRVASLTPREREVMAHIIAGKLNKQTADDLGTVEKTIKVHRARILAKMGVHSVAELTRLAERVGIQPA